MWKFICFSVLCCLSIPAMGQKKPVKNSPAPVKANAATLDYNKHFAPLKWRSIGPFRGGRSGAVTGVVGDPNTYYMGVTGGGVWKTSDMGNTWSNISDGFFSTGSVGAIAVAESDPSRVYVGMGEHAVRGVMTHHGDGVYVSADAGKTWKKSGLEKTQHIARIVVHPKQPDVVYVAAQGPLYSASAERGVFKSTDGGVTWNKVLFVDDKTGCAELVLDPSKPNVLYAAMWEHGRLPWKVISGGPGSSLYKSVDAGATWTKINNGLPEEKGKMAITICRSNPEKLYTLVESDSEQEKGGLFVSNDAGASWSLVTNDHRLVQRAWYYIEIFADPKNENALYVLSAPALYSIDGGKSWSEINGAHGDYHDLWIHPDNPKNMVMGDDGGASISLNGGATWSTQANMPTAQLYRINADNDFPYHVYAGQQDNTSVKLASAEHGSGGISAKSWWPSAGGESAFLAFNPDQTRYVLGGSYLGTIEVWDHATKSGTKIMAAPIQYLARETKEMKYRFNWNAPIIWSKHEPTVYYHAAQHLLRTDDMGKSWKEFSPDLTRNEKTKQGKGGGPYTNEAVGAENYGTIAYVTESPHEKGVFYTGSDDGLVHLTKDNGATWQNITPPGLKECLVNAIDVSPHDKGTVYIATTRYKFNDHSPGLYKSTDYGKTWVNINNGIPETAFTRVVREDQVRKGLLFAGTETGVYISWNGGQQWHAFQLNLPVTPVTDLKVHQNNLIAATSGRSFWILDDLFLLRQFNEADTAKSKLYASGSLIQVNASSEMDRNDSAFKGAHPTRGVNPATGAVLYFQWPGLSKASDLQLVVKDSKGQVIRTIRSQADSTFQAYDGGPSPDAVLPKEKGLNRFVWDLRHQSLPGIPTAYIEGSYRGHRVVPGRYTLELKEGSTVLSTQLDVLAHPELKLEKVVLMEYDSLMRHMSVTLTNMYQLVNTTYKKRMQLESLLQHIGSQPAHKTLHEEGKLLVSKLKQWDEDMVQRKSKAYDDVENFPNKFSAEYIFLLNQTEGEMPRVNQPNKDRLAELTREWNALEARVRLLLDQELPAFNKKAWAAGFGAVWQ